MTWRLIIDMVSLQQPSLMALTESLRGSKADKGSQCLFLTTESIIVVFVIISVRAVAQHRCHP